VLRERMAATATVAQLRPRHHRRPFDIENVPIQRCKPFMHLLSARQLLLVTGRFDEAAALRLVERHFGKTPRPARALTATTPANRPRTANAA